MSSVPLLTVEAGSTTADLVPYTGTFTVSVQIASGTSGQQLSIYRSLYNDGNTWSPNSPDLTCMLASDKLCTFHTDHLSLFSFGSAPSLSINVPTYSNTRNITAVLS